MPEKCQFPIWVYQIYRIVPHIRIQIHVSALKPNRVFGDEPAHLWVIVPCPHVVEAVRFSHDAVLPHKLEGLGNGLFLICDLAKLK